MNSEVSWLHLSDFHVGKDGYEESEMFDRIIKHVKQRMDVDGLTPDLIFITGDIADKGAAKQYEKFWDGFLSPLHSLIGGDIQARTFLVPGNHDINRSINKTFDRTEYGKSNEQYFDPTEAGASDRKMLADRFKDYIDTDLTGHSSAFADSAGAYAVSRNIKGYNLGIVGVNTAWLCRDSSDEGLLTLGRPLLEKALKQVHGSDLAIVLGHHPIEWIAREQQRPIKAILGQNHCLYLHGHLHDAWGEPVYGGGESFIAIQSGAAFQARDSDRWRNGFVWGKACIKTGRLSLQPFRWNTNHQDWALNTDAFSNKQRNGDWWFYTLPSSSAPAKRQGYDPLKESKLPGGWEIKSAIDLEPNLEALDTNDAVAFFDGAVPNWSTALSRSIPRRDIVHRLAASFKNGDASNMPRVTLLTAAGCEGKTTALLQSAYEVIKDKADWSILRRTNDSRPFNVTELAPFLSEEGNWLVLLDGADQVAKDVFSFAESGIELAKGKVSFLLACRDSDWLAAEADKLLWKSVAAFKQEQLSGLSPDDSAKIIESWSAYGNTGLGNLALTEPSLRSNRFLELANLEAKSSARSSTGAFFGALLGARHGDDLLDHAKVMLDKLETITIPTGGTLKDAIALISVMHAESQDYLSIPVLAKALDCDMGKFHATVIRPLGQEAAATSTSTCIYTRHRYIAQAIVRVLEVSYQENIADHYKQLVCAALKAYHDGAFIKDLHSWRYDLAKHFKDTERPLLAIDIAQVVFDYEPNEPRAITNLAFLHRTTQEPSYAVQIFRSADVISDNRPYYHEWSMSEFACRNYLESTALAAYALCDECNHMRPTVDDVSGYLSNVGVGFNRLYNLYLDPDFEKAHHSVMSIRLIFSPVKLSAELREFRQRVAKRRANEYDIDVALKYLSLGVLKAIETGVTPSVAEAVAGKGELNFDGLKILANNKLTA